MADFNPLDLLAAAAELQQPETELANSTVTKPTTNTSNPNETNFRHDASDSRENQTNTAKIVSASGNGSFGTTDNSILKDAVSSSAVASVDKTTTSNSANINSTNSDPVSKDDYSALTKKSPVLLNSSAKSDKGVSKVYLNPTTGQRFHVLNVQKTTQANIQTVVSSTHVHQQGAGSKSISANASVMKSVLPQVGQIISTTNTKGQNVLTIVNSKTQNDIPTASSAITGALTKAQIISRPNNAQIVSNSLVDKNTANTNSSKPPYMMIRLPAGLSPDVRAATLKSLIPSALLAKGFKVTTVPLNTVSTSSLNNIKTVGPVTSTPPVVLNKTSLTKLCSVAPTSSISAYNTNNNATMNSLPSVVASEPNKTVISASNVLPNVSKPVLSMQSPTSKFVQIIPSAAAIGKVCESGPNKTLLPQPIPVESTCVKHSVQNNVVISKTEPVSSSQVKLDNNQNAVKSLIISTNSVNSKLPSSQLNHSAGFDNKESTVLQAPGESPSVTSKALHTAVLDSVMVTKITEDIKKSDFSEDITKTVIPNEEEDTKVLPSTSKAEIKFDSIASLFQKENIKLDTETIKPTVGISPKSALPVANGTNTKFVHETIKSAVSVSPTSVIQVSNGTNLHLGVSNSGIQRMAEQLPEPVAMTPTKSTHLPQTVQTSPASKGMTAVVTGFGFPSRLLVKTDSDNPVFQSHSLTSVPLSRLKHDPHSTTGVKNQTIVNPLFSYPNYRIQQKQPTISKYVDNFGNYVKAGQRLPDIKIPAGAKINHPLRDHDYCYHVFYELAINSHLPEKVKKPRERKRKSTEKSESNSATTQEPKPAKRKYVRKSKSSTSEPVDVAEVKCKVEDVVQDVKLEASIDEDTQPESGSSILPNLPLLMGDAKSETEAAAPELEPRKKRKYTRKSLKSEDEYFENGNEPVKISGSDNFQDQFIYFATKRLKSRTRDLSKKSKLESTLTPWPFGNDPCGPVIPLGPYASIGGLPSRTPPHPNQVPTSTAVPHESSSEAVAGGDFNPNVPAALDEIGQLFDYSNGNFRTGLDEGASKQNIEDLVMNMTPDQIQAVVNLMSGNMNKSFPDISSEMVHNTEGSDKISYESLPAISPDSFDGKDSFQPQPMGDYSKEMVPLLSQLAFNAVPAEQASALPKVNNMPSHQEASVYPSQSEDVPTESSVVNAVLSLVSDSVAASPNGYRLPATVEEANTEVVETTDFDDFSQINITPMEPLNQQDFSHLNTTPTGAGLFDLDDNILNTSVANMSMLFDSEFTTSPLSKAIPTMTDTIVTTSPLVTPDRLSQLRHELKASPRLASFLPPLPTPSTRTNLFPEADSDFGKGDRVKDTTLDDGSCTPVLTTVSMYWNTFPALMMKGSQYMRLVDIHKQALPAKDTGLLKKRCQTMGLPYLNCTELQRDFLIRYAYASPSRSTIIVSKEVAQTLISSYVNPVPKVIPRRKGSGTSETIGKAAKGGKGKESTKVTSGGYMTPETEDGNPLPDGTQRDLFKVKDASQDDERKKKKKPVKLKLRVLRKSESEVEYVPATRTYRPPSNYEKRDHLRRTKHVDYKRMILPTARPSSKDGEESSIDPDMDVTESVSKLLDMPPTEFSDEKSKREYQKLLEKNIRKKILEEKAKLRRIKKRLKSNKKGSKKGVVQNLDTSNTAEMEEGNLEHSIEDVSETSPTESVPRDETVPDDKTETLEHEAENTMPVTCILENEENTALSETKEAELLRDSSELSVGENLEVSPKLKLAGSVKNCEVSMSKLPPLEIVHRDAVHKRQQRGSSQDGDLYFHLYCSSNSQCIACSECRHFFTVSEFLKHTHNVGEKDKLIQVSVRQNLELRSSKPTEDENSLWELFLKKQKILDHNPSDSKNLGESESKLVSAIEESIMEKTRLAAEPEPELHKETRQSSRVRKRKQLYPIEKYTYSKLLPNSAPIVKDIPYLPNVEFQDTVFSELEPRLLPQEIPRELKTMTLSISPMKKSISGYDSCDSTNSVSPDVVKKYDLSPRTLTPSRFSSRHLSKVVTEKNGHSNKPGQYTALSSCDL